MRRGSAKGAPSTAQLLRQLKRLKSKTRQNAKGAQRTKKKRCEAQDEHGSSTGSSGSSRSMITYDLSYLPQNEQLEASLGAYILKERDPRAKLAFLGHLKSASLLSLAAPVTPRWDPYDIKPQVFALDKYFGLPVFTNLAYMTLFCRRFKFAVQDPSGRDWVCEQAFLDDSSGRAEENDEDNDVSNKKTKNSVTSRLEGYKRFDISQATPLPIFGPPLRSCFFGYFADLKTLLHNIQIVPEKVDIVLNPCSSLEFVMSRDIATDILGGQMMMRNAFRDVAKQLMSEFLIFFERECPEVQRAMMACAPHLVPSTAMEADRVEHDIVLVIDTVGAAGKSTFDWTLRRIRKAKERMALVGHPSLHILPLEAAPPHIVECAKCFYERQLEGVQTPGTRAVRPMRVMTAEDGRSSVKINPLVPSDDIFADPDMRRM